MIFNVLILLSTGPDSPPENTNISELGSTSATIAWSPPPPEDQNGPIIYYILIISNLQFNLNDIIINTSFTSYTLSDLQAFNIYSYRVAAATEVGVGPFSDSIIFMTLEDGKYGISFHELH